jgi:hypothetical protein
VFPLEDEDEIERLEEALRLDPFKPKRQERARTTAARRQLGDIIDGVTAGLGRPTGGEGAGVGMGETGSTDQLEDDLASPSDATAGQGSSTSPTTGTGTAGYTVPTYNSPLQYAVPKTGYYCVGKLRFP